MEDRKQISNKILSLMKEQKKTYRDLEKITHISRSTIQRYVTNTNSKFPVDNLKKIALALEVSPSFLMGLNENSTFAKRLRELRKKNNYTMDELAESYNNVFDGELTKGTISKYENGRQEPMMKVVNNFAKIFSVSADYLLGWDYKESEMDKIIGRIKQLDEAKFNELKKYLDFLESQKV